MRAIIAVSLLCSFVFMQSNQAVGGVSVGAKIPHTLTLLDQNRKKRSFSDMTGKKGIVLVFVRSANWSTQCQKQILELNQNQKRFKDKGYNVVTVSYDSVLSMTDFLRKNKPNITILSDPRSNSIRAFGVLDDKPAIGTRSYGTAQPVVYIVDAKQKVQAQFFHQNTQNRPTIKDILSKIDRLNPKSKERSYELPMTIEAMGQDPIIPGDDIIVLPEGELPDVLSFPDDGDSHANSHANSGISLSPDDYEAAVMAVNDSLVEEGSSDK